MRSSAFRSVDQRYASVPSEISRASRRISSRHAHNPNSSPLVTMSSLHTLIAAGLAGLAAAQTSTGVNSILTPATCTNLVANGNFEQDSHRGAPG